MSLLQIANFDKILENHKKILAISKTPNFKLTTPGVDERLGGSLQFSFNPGCNHDNSTIMIWRNKVEITYKDWPDYWWCLVVLEGLLQEEKDGGLNEVVKRYITDSRFPEHFTLKEYNSMFGEYPFYLAKEKYPNEEVLKVLIEMTTMATMRMHKKSSNNKSTN